MVDGPGWELCFQEVPGAKVSRNRLHFDVVASDAVGEARRLCEIGASVSELFDDHAVMIDPEGNEFCVYGS
jgi:hypothetical protein